MQYRLSIEKLSPEQQLEEIESFKNYGWEYIGNINLADVHTFAVFQWNKSSEPTLPPKYENNKN